VRVDREKFLQDLESVQPGLSQKEIVEQSSCFIFKDGKVMTFNDEIACRRTTAVKMTGAVSAAPLISLLQKLTNEEIEIEPKESSLLVKAKNKRASIRMEKEILLPMDAIETPKEWKPLPEDFIEAIDLTQQCASEDASNFAICCIHITPKYLEATDNFQLTRYKIKTGVKENVLVKQNSIKHIVQLGMSEFCETESWMHFRNKQSGLYFTCRRWVEEFPDMTEFLQVEGDSLKIPKGIGDTVDKAEIFSSEDPDKNEVEVEIRPGKMRIKGKGQSGWYQEMKSLQYSGKPLVFHISPKLLVQVSNRANECFVSADRLKIDGGKFVYVVSLGTPDEKDDDDGGQSGESEDTADE
jgi:hypothetical protein